MYFCSQCLYNHIMFAGTQYFVSQKLWSVHCVTSLLSCFMSCHHQRSTFRIQVPFSKLSLIKTITIGLSIQNLLSKTITFVNKDLGVMF